MTDILTSFDNLLNEDGPAAIALKQPLQQVGDEVVFPPSYANPSKTKGDPPVYNIDELPGENDRKSSTCVIDSIPSQANRIEPAFAKIVDGALVPQIHVTAEKTNEKVSLLKAGHRAADAIVRFSTLSAEFDEAFKAQLAGDSLPMAKLAPTSLVFGVWDSRVTGVKIARLLNSVIRATDVSDIRRSAQYVPALADYAAAGVEKDAVKKLSEHGMAAVPAVHQPGGVMVHGGIVRSASLNLVTLRDININTPDQKVALKLRRYILGLALVALTFANARTLNLRQGCQLTGVPGQPSTQTLISADGTEKPFDLTAEQALDYAQATAKDFGVGDNHPDAIFDPKLAAKAAKEASKKKDDAAKAAK